MTKRNDGGHAYPLLELNQITGGVLAQHFGMSLRDRISIAAMAAIMQDERSEDLTKSEIAHDAYRIADAMLEARDK